MITPHPPGIFPSFFYDYGKRLGREAYLGIIERAVVNGSADGVYADCYGQYGLVCNGERLRGQPLCHFVFNYPDLHIE